MKPFTFSRYVIHHKKLRTSTVPCTSPYKRCSNAASFALQVFVANPNKPPNIQSILRRNKEKLISFLEGFHNDRDGKCAGSPLRRPSRYHRANSSFGWYGTADEQFNVSVAASGVTFITMAKYTIDVPLTSLVFGNTG